MKDYREIESRIERLEKRVEETRTSRAVVVLSIALILHILASWLL